MPAITCVGNLIFFFLVFSLLLPCNNSDQLVVEYEYAANGIKGPEKWGEIDPKWQACLHGKKQSPIDVRNKTVVAAPELGPLKRDYKPAPVNVTNRGHDIMVSFNGDAGEIMINGTKYSLKQCHWHSPAEHSIEGVRNDLELHMVHESKEGTRSVVGILYKIGKEDPYLAEVLQGLNIGSRATGGPGGPGGGDMDPMKIGFGTRKYYRYEGSLTAPPCTEGVIWTIIKRVKTASKEQISKLKGALLHGFQDNARPSQSLNDRTVYTYSKLKDSKKTEL